MKVHRQVITLRPASTADHHVVVELLGELIDELGPPALAKQVREKLDGDVATALGNPDVSVIIAERQGSAVGVARGDILTADPIFRLREDHRCGYIDQIFVRSPYRQQGIGQELLRRLEEIFRARGIGHCLLHAAPKAVSFYNRLGYATDREMYKRLA